MITADTLKALSNFTAEAITRAIRVSGYKKDSFTEAKFLGLTNAGQFCYMCTYEDEVGNEDTCKVFLTYDAVTGAAKAEY